MKKTFILLALVTAISFLTGFSNNNAEVSAKESETFAKCAIAAFRQEYETAKAIFIGKVLSVREEGDGKKIFEFKVEKYWKGIKTKKIEVGVFETTRYQAIYKVGETYLVYARAGNDGKLVDKRCSRSRDAEGDYAADDLRQLGKGKRMK